jgi:hypothetical protein
MMAIPTFSIGTDERGKESKGCHHTKARHKIMKANPTWSAGDIVMKSTAVPVNLERIVKKLKTPVCAIDFDNAFCKATFMVKVNDEVEVRQFLSHVSD